MPNTSDMEIYIMNSEKSENSIILLEYLKSNIKTLNNNGYYIKFELINEEDINNEEYKQNMIKKGFLSIPSIKISEEIISGMNQVMKILTDICDHKTKQEQNPYNMDEEEKYKSMTEDFMQNEILSRDNENELNLDDENDKNDLTEKLRKFEKQRKGENVNTNKSSVDDYENKINNQIKKKKKIEVDDDTQMLLDRMDMEN
jgi:hypothetical protein